MPQNRRADGAYLIDDTAKRYVDGSGGAVISCVGHGNREVIDAINRQLDLFQFAFSGISRRMQSMACIVVNSVDQTLRDVIPQ